MKRIVITFLYAVTGLLSYAQWQISNGPYGGNVTRIIRHGQYLLAGLLIAHDSEEVRVQVTRSPEKGL